MLRLLDFIGYLVNLYEWVVIIYIIIGWLTQFGVINGYNPFVRSLQQAMSIVIEPLLKPIRRMMPNTGGLDFSPIVLMLGCLFTRAVIIENLKDLVR
jgi:YggT family protein